MQELFTSKAVVYLPKPDRQTLQLIKEFEMLQGIDRTEEQESRFQELLNNEPSTTEVRITLGTVSAWKQAKYQSYIQKVRSWFENETGMPPSDFLEDVPEESDDHKYMMELLTMSYAWAGILASTQKYEVRNYPLLTTIVDTEWTEKPLPAEWKDITPFLDSLPNELLWALNNTANEVNPSLWRLPSDEPSKKFGVMSAS